MFSSSIVSNTILFVILFEWVVNNSKSAVAVASLVLNVSNSSTETSSAVYVFRRLFVIKSFLSSCFEFKSLVLMKDLIAWVIWEGWNAGLMPSIDYLDSSPSTVRVG